MSNSQKEDSTQSKNLSEEDHQISDQDLLMMGEDVARLLNSPAYHFAYQVLLQQNREEWRNTHPKEIQKRESLWHEQKALERIQLNLKSILQEAQIQSQKQNASQEKRQNQRLDTQGFGLDEEGEFAGHGQY